MAFGIWLMSSMKISLSSSICWVIILNNRQIFYSVFVRLRKAPIFFAKNNAEVNQFLWNEGYSWLFAQNKNWLYLAQKEAYDDINWEDFVTSSDNKLLVYKSAYKAGEADFLLFHRQYKYYFRLKWKQLWKKKKTVSNLTVFLFLNRPRARL